MIQPATRSDEERDQRGKRAGHETQDPSRDHDLLMATDHREVTVVDGVGRVKARHTTIVGRRPTEEQVGAGTGKAVAPTAQRRAIVCP